MPLFRSCLVVCALLIAAPCAWAQAPATNASGKDVVESGENVSLNFNGADIDSVIRAVGKITGRNFLIDPRVKGTINIVTSRPVNRTMVYQILLSALRLQGYAAVDEGKIVKIVPEADAKLHAVPTPSSPSQAPGGDRIITEVFQIKNESAAQLVQVVRPLVAPNNTVSVYPGNNSLVITDYAENMARIRRIIESIDVPQSDAQVIRVQNASAVDLAPMISRLFEGSNEPNQKVSIIADARTNSLLLRSDNRSRLQAARSMIAQLDAAGTLGNLRIVYLKNGDATRIAQTLRAIVSGETTSGSGASSSRPSATTQPAAAGQAGTTTTTSGAGAPSGGGGMVGGAYIYADTSTNSIVINASDSLYNNLRGIIDQLDRRPAQIYVEALIAEVSAEKASEFGIQWNSAAPSSGKTTVFGGTNFSSGGNNILGLSANPASAGSGLNIAVGGGTVQIPGVGTILNISMLARYLETDNKTNILSTPSLVTVDNEEAKIVVGRNVPFITGTFTNNSTGVSNPFQTIERKDVGLTLKIKPQITEGGSVRLLISQEASSVLSTSPTTGPTTSKRSLDSTVIVDDGAFLALGGLVEDSFTGSVEKVPVLGDIPIIGSLFRYDTRTHNKTNLVIFLRPVIMRSPEDSAGITGSRYDYVIGQQKASASKDGIIPVQTEEPVLPLRMDTVPPALWPSLPPAPAPASSTPGPVVTPVPSPSPVSGSK